jgi:hypothetical protein
MGMTTRLFLGVRSSFLDQAQNSARDFLDAMNRVLAENGMEPYADPVEPVNPYIGHLFGRSTLDRSSPRVFVELAGLAQVSKTCPNLALIRDNPRRVTFVPRPLPRPLATGYFEQIGGNDVQIWVGSLSQLATELLRFAHDLRIPVTNHDVTDETVGSINMFRPFHERDSTKLIEEYRPAWLALHEGVRMALQHGVALTLAG